MIRDRKGKSGRRAGSSHWAYVVKFCERGKREGAVEGKIA